MGKGVDLAGTFRRRDTALKQLPEKPLALNAGFFRDLVGRIETIVPTQDPKQENNEIQIIIKKPEDKSSPGLVISAQASFTSVTLNVCSNGTPATIVVLSKASATSA